MSRCLGEKTLVLLHAGESMPAAREHLETCARCAARYQKLVHDLELIDRALRGIPPTVSIERAAAPRWQWMPAAATAAVLIVAIAGGSVWLRRSPVDVQPLIVVRSADTKAFLDEVSAVLFSTADANVTVPPADSPLLQTVLNEASCSWWDAPCDDLALIDALLGPAWLEAET